MLTLALGFTDKYALTTPDFQIDSRLSVGKQPLVFTSGVKLQTAVIIFQWLLCVCLGYGSGVRLRVLVFNFVRWRQSGPHSSDLTR